MGSPNTTCERCEKRFYRRPSQKELYEHHYCSVGCMGTANSARAAQKRAEITEKTCTKCKETKLIEAFGWKDKRANRRNSWCKDCQNEYGRKHYRENRGKYGRQVRAYKIWSKKDATRAVFDYLSEHPCEDCGNDDVLVLEFHHLRDKEETISAMVCNSFSVEQIMEEIAKCVVLCANCHRKRTFESYGGHPYVKYGWIQESVV